MNTRRTAPMLTLGLINFTVGAWFVAIAVLLLVIMVRSGPLLEQAAALSPESSAGTSSRLPEQLHTLRALVGLVGGAILAVAGMGLMRLKPWGRTLTILASWCVVLLFPVAIALTLSNETDKPGFSFWLLGYALLSLSLLHSREWREAFTPQPPPAPNPHPAPGPSPPPFPTGTPPTQVRA